MICVVLRLWPLQRMVAHPAFCFFTGWSKVFTTVSDGCNPLWQTGQQSVRVWVAANRVGVDGGARGLLSVDVGCFPKICELRICPIRILTRLACTRTAVTLIQLSPITDCFMDCLA